MGFGSNHDSRADELAEEQINLNKAELERKSRSLFQTRLDILKNQGGESWHPNRMNSNPTAAPAAPAGNANTIPERLDQLKGRDGKTWRDMSQSKGF